MKGLQMTTTTIIKVLLAIEACMMTGTSLQLHIVLRSLSGMAFTLGLPQAYIPRF